MIEPTLTILAALAAVVGLTSGAGYGLACRHSDTARLVVGAIAGFLVSFAMIVLMIWRALWSQAQVSEISADAGFVIQPDLLIPSIAVVAAAVVTTAASAVVASGGLGAMRRLVAVSGLVTALAASGAIYIGTGATAQTSTLQQWSSIRYGTQIDEEAASRLLDGDAAEVGNQHLRLTPDGAGGAIITGTDGREIERPAPDTEETS